MSRLKDIGNVWSTIKELDVRDIRDQAEVPVRIGVVGVAGPTRDLVEQAFLGDARRFPARGPALELFSLPLSRDRGGDLGRADLALLVLDGARPLGYDEFLAYEKLAVLPVPLLLVVGGAAALPSAADQVPAPDWSGAPAVFLDNPADQEASRKKIRAAVIELLPENLVLAAARRLPGLRGEAARHLIASVALSNATFAFTSGLPEMIPLLNLPLNAADMLVLTKNQALLAYRVALAMGADGDFSVMVKELLPVIGGGFIWRQLARQLVGLLPGVGLLPKVAVAYAGTFATGIAAARWYERGEMVSRAELKRIAREALADGRARAKALVKARSSAKANDLPAAREAAGDAAEPRAEEAGLIRRTVRRIRRRKNDQ